MTEKQDTRKLGLFRLAPEPLTIAVVLYTPEPCGCTPFNVKRALSANIVFSFLLKRAGCSWA